VPRLVPLVLIGFVAALSGCVTSSKYRMARKVTPPAPLSGLSVRRADLELTVPSLIVVQGPGSWKRDARWDEYLVQLTNHGGQPVTIESAELVDILGQLQRPGDDPWKLEKLSYTNWDNYGKAGVSLLAGAGVAYIYGGVALMSAFSGSVATADAMIVAFPWLLVADVAVVAVKNNSNKGKVQREFTRRRVSLPRTLAAGESVSGSLFFPMTPGPQRLTLKGTSQDTPFELVLELPPLAGLHLKPLPPAPHPR
jgi:hypothetical protein